MTHKEPAQLADAIERTASLPMGEDERFVGYGVMAAPFSSGDLLAMRRFAASSLGHAYTSVWHRAKNGDWTMYTDQSPLEACPRYFGSAIARSIETPIGIEWPLPRRMEITVPLADLNWSVELEDTAATRFLNALGSSMSDRMWQNPRLLSAMCRVAAAVLDSGKLGLAGHAPNGQSFVANPMMLWVIRTSSAKLGGRDLGSLAPLPEQQHLGDFWLPQRGLFAFGRAFFEPFDATRHQLITQKPRAPEMRRAPPQPPP
jgi:hypothetical protein